MEDDKELEQDEKVVDKQKLVSRRDFLVGLRKWSAAVIGVTIVGGVLLPEETRGQWINRRATWVNGGGGGWINRGGTWVNRGSAWANRAGGGAAWVNRRGW